jgi:hypothetical protein
MILTKIVEILFSQSRGRQLGGYENARRINVMRAGKLSPRQRQVKSGDMDM